MRTKLTARLPALIAAGAASLVLIAADNPPHPDASPVPLLPVVRQRAIVDGHRVQPRAQMFSAPGRVDIGPEDAKILDRLYRKQIEEGRQGPVH